MISRSYHFVSAVKSIAKVSSIQSPRFGHRYLQSKAIQSGPTFTDHVHIRAEAGRGGDGCVSFMREKYLPKGPPNGGSGGHGGDIYIMAVEGQQSLNVSHTIKADKGMSGKGSSMNGRKGTDLVIQVPIGTIVRELELPENMREPEDRNDSGRWVHFPRYEDENLQSDRLKEAERILNYHQKSFVARGRQKKIVLDLDTSTKHNEPHLLCKGGVGGFGNTIFMTADNRAPRIASRGLIGEQKYFELELKTLADIGLVGLPNAGKSTFLRAISKAKPKVGDYAFTTLTPHLGTIAYDDGRFTVADIPGIIEGASRNKGLGHGFLRHIERASILCFVIDLSRSPVEDYLTLRQELQNYLPGLQDRRAMIIANKADLAEAQSNLASLKQAVQTVLESSSKNSSVPMATIVPISALNQLGVDRVLQVMQSMIKVARAEDASSLKAKEEIAIQTG